jgi:hypothetical protein
MSASPTESNLIIIGLDPGKACGFATYQTATSDFTSDDLTMEVALDRVYALMYGNNLRTVLSVERFTPNGQRAITAQTHALETIGAARYIARRLTALRFMTPGASEAQGIGTPEALRKLGWWAPGYDHRNKAASQVAYALATTLPHTFEELTR